ncbi:hypothetical protein F53441_13405 [Fusarium austroafricanum]|uniref:NACHT domain-containing protein n=1 Tax=Fusarium austroafricanum TaxID=2364996 RepID=A0A8H4JR09_9HYPO|nr:hypothetical protein F53441_13405 [Fusarium austroafricanum]
MELSKPLASRPSASQADSLTAVKQLESTIASFQAILTDDDRKQLQQLKNTAHDSQNIITFTAELDRLDKGRRGKSVASRLASFLQTIEQFTPIVDTYIQSNPDIAALIWGSVKVTFLFLANFTSYFQSFVELLHGFGSLCTRFAEYQVVFNDSPRLRSSICHFHTAVINCCQQIVIVARRPMKTQIIKAITQSFQSELRSYVDDIRAKAEGVQGDIQLAKAQCDREEQQLQSVERQEATDHRSSLLAWTSKFSADMQTLEAQRKQNTAEQKRRRFLEDLSSFNFTSAFNSTRNKRHLGTAEWVFETEQFQEWEKHDRPSVLHVTGKIGSGKTVLASSIVERLSRTSPPQQFVSFFFLRFDDPLSLDADTIIRSCVQQLLSAISMDRVSQDMAAELDECLSQAKSNLFSYESLTRLYAAASNTIKNWFVILDGLDECSTGQQSRLLKFFREVLFNTRPDHRMKILLSSRETCTSSIRRIFPGSERLVTGQKQTSADIDAYVNDIIQDKLDAGELAVRDPELEYEIFDTIRRKEQGMFLWAFLTVEDICSGKSDSEIRQALKEIPTDIDATFDRALRRIVQKRNQDIAKRVFSWTKAALQPLTLSQLREALSIVIGQHTLRQEDLISGIERLPVWCENLVYVEETDSTVRFSHHSIQEYLLTPNSGEFHDLHINVEESDRLAGEACITYINLNNFNTTLTKTRNTTSNPTTLSLDPSAIAEQTTKKALEGSVGIRMGRLARRVVRSPKSAKTLTNDEFSISAPISISGSSERNVEYPFLSYVAKNWFKHTRYVESECNKDVWRLLGRTVQKPSRFPQDEPWLYGNWRVETENRILSLVEAFLPHPSKYNWLERSLAFLGSSRSESSEALDLFLAFMYADLKGYLGLACRSFQLLAEFGQKSDEIQRAVSILAANKDHKTCRNHCLSLAISHLDHVRFVEDLREAIANGMTFLPATAGPETRNPCYCSEEPPRRESDPYFQAFAVLAEAVPGNLPNISKLILRQRKENAQFRFRRPENGSQ